MQANKTKTPVFGIRSVFARLFISVFMALMIFAFLMVVWLQIVHQNSDSFQNNIVARQIAYQLEPFIIEVDTHIQNQSRLQTRFSLVVLKKTLDIFDENLNANIGIYAPDGTLLLQTQSSSLSPKLLSEISWVGEFLPSANSANHAQIKITHGYTLWYEKRDQKIAKPFAPFYNLLTGSVLLTFIMTLALWWLAKSMTYRINAMSKQIYKMGEGDFSGRVSEVGDDEISFLARGINQSAQKIEQLLSANKLLLAHASHEFRTPITRMRLQTEMLNAWAQNLCDDKMLLENFTKRTRAINQDLIGLNDLIESILLVSRLGAGGVIEQMQTVDMLQIVKQEAKQFDNAQSISVFGQSVHLLANDKLMLHLVRNLLGNAFIHGSPPVSVHVYTTKNIEDASVIPKLPFVDLDEDLNKDDAKNHNSVQQNTNLSNAASSKTKKLNGTKFLSSKTTKTPTLPKAYAVLAVIDSGTGIDIHKRSDIFSPFVRLNNDKKGSGLGLSLVAQIVQLHQGQISTDTWQNNTRFLVVLPIWSVH